MSENYIELDGDVAKSVKVLIDDIEDLTIEQVEEMANQEAFTGDIRIMPDGHPGRGSVVGFSMPIGDKVVPNTIGVDIGCGMFAAQLPGSTDIYDWDHRAILDKAIRKRVPVGFDIHDRGDYHMHNDFPYDICQRKLDEFNKNSEFDHIDHEYDTDYYDDLISRIDTSAHRASNSVGTLGGGNHFIEIGESQNVVDEIGTGELVHPFWVIIHSGSRNIGASICDYWQNRAAIIQKSKDIRSHLSEYPEDYITFDLDAVSDNELLDWVLGANGDFVNYEAIPKEEREKYKDELKECVPENGKKGSDYDYLTGEAAHGYIIDMIFAQTYASVNRKEMAKAVLDAWLETMNPLEFWAEDDPERPDGFIQTIESTHNYIDFEDQIIRKGATRAHKGERAIVPYNMRDGTLIVKGKGNEEWNKSINHGAGRVDSRGWAGNEVTQKEANEEIETSGVYASIVPRDEAPHSYKNWEKIEEAMAPSAEIEDRIKPLISIKAETRYYDEEE